MFDRFVREKICLKCDSINYLAITRKSLNFSISNATFIPNLVAPNTLVPSDNMSRV